MALGLSGGANYASFSLGSTLLAATLTGVGITTLMLPATNTKGFLIQSIDYSKTGIFDGTLYADTSAPASGVDITKRAIRAFSANGGASLATPDFPELLLPPGYGLYIAVNALSVANVAFWVNGILL